MLELDLEPEQFRLEHAQRLLQQLLTRLVPVQDDDPDRLGHGGPSDAGGSMPGRGGRAAVDIAVRWRARSRPELGCATIFGNEQVAASRRGSRGPRGRRLAAQPRQSPKVRTSSPVWAGGGLTHRRAPKPPVARRIWAPSGSPGLPARHPPDRRPSDPGRGKHRTRCGATRSFTAKSSTGSGPETRLRDTARAVARRPRLVARRSGRRQQLVAASGERGDHDLDVLVEVDPERLGAGDSSSRPTAAAKLGCFIFFLTDLAVIPFRPSGRT